MCIVLAFSRMTYAGLGSRERLVMYICFFSGLMSIMHTCVHMCMFGAAVHVLRYRNVLIIISIIISIIIICAGIL